MLSRYNDFVKNAHDREDQENVVNELKCLEKDGSLLKVKSLFHASLTKRPGIEDPVPPYNMVRNVLDMNAHFGGFTSALLEAGKSVWVMNVVPTSGPNQLPLILDRWFPGMLHDWYVMFFHLSSYK